MLRYNLEEFSYNHDRLIKSGEVVLVKNTLEEPTICYYDGCEFNDIDKYEKLNTYHNGGCYVAFKNDFVVAHFGIERDTNDFMNLVLLKFVDKLKEKLPEENIEFTGNDILINNKKISGGSTSDYIGFFIGYNPDVEVIKEVCNKEMEKIPGGLSEYISDFEIERILEDIIIDFENREIRKEE